MIIKCFRCKKNINTPSDKNADYIIASDTVVREPVGVLFALKHNKETRTKAHKMQEHDAEGRPKYPGLKIEESEYDVVELPNFQASKVLGEDLIKVKAEVQERDIQKTGIICPGCYKPTDFIIWGVHKKKVK